MKLALLTEVRDTERMKILIEYDLNVYKTRIARISYEHYLNNKNEIIKKIFRPTKWTKLKGYIFRKLFERDLNDEIIRDIFRDAVKNAITTIDKELRKAVFSR